MSLANYSDLQGAISDWVARGDVLEPRLPDFIALTESRIQQELDVTDSEATETITPVADQASYPLPSDYKTMRSVQVDGTPMPHPLAYRTPTQFTAENTQSGETDIYTIKGLNIIIGPTPGGNSPVFYLDYIARFVPLSDNNTTNWILTNFPDVYLFGSLAEASAYDRNVQAEQKWWGRFTSAIASVRLYLEGQRFGGSPLEIRSA
jgi:hypothetical protein